MKAKEVISTIKKIGHETGCNKFFFSVDAADPAFLEKLSAALASASSGITYCLDERLEKKFAEEDFVDRLSRSGCRAISFGMDSAAQPTLDAMQKGKSRGYFPRLYECQIDAGYPDYEKFQKAIFSLFPALGRVNRVPEAALLSQRETL